MLIEIEPLGRDTPALLAPEDHELATRLDHAHRAALATGAARATAAIPALDLARLAAGSHPPSAGSIEGWDPGWTDHDLAELAATADAVALVHPHGTGPALEGADWDAIDHHLNQGWTVAITEPSVGSALTALVEDLERTLDTDAEVVVHHATGAALGPQIQARRKDVLALQVTGERHVLLQGRRRLRPRVGPGGVVVVPAGTPALHLGLADPVTWIEIRLPRTPTANRRELARLRAHRKPRTPVGDTIGGAVRAPLPGGFQVETVDDDTATLVAARHRITASRSADAWFVALASGDVVDDDHPDVVGAISSEDLERLSHACHTAGLVTAADPHKTTQIA